MGGAAPPVSRREGEGAGGQWEPRRRFARRPECVDEARGYGAAPRPHCGVTIVPFGGVCERLDSEVVEQTPLAMRPVLQPGGEVNHGDHPIVFGRGGRDTTGAGRLGEEISCRGAR